MSEWQAIKRYLPILLLNIMSVMTLWMTPFWQSAAFYCMLFAFILLVGYSFFGSQGRCLNGCVVMLFLVVNVFLLGVLFFTTQTTGDLISKYHDTQTGNTYYAFHEFSLLEFEQLHVQMSSEYSPFMTDVTHVDDRFVAWVPQASQLSIRVDGGSMVVVEIY